MPTVFVAMGLLIVAFAFMAGALHFAQYKKKQQSCCSDALDLHERGSADDAACSTCPRRDEEKAQCDRFAAAREQLASASGRS